MSFLVNSLHKMNKQWGFVRLPLVAHKRFLVSLADAPMAIPTLKDAGK